MRGAAGRYPLNSTLRSPNCATILNWPPSAAAAFQLGDPRLGYAHEGGDIGLAVGIRSQ
jgi:hypothetical protein